MHKAGLSNVYYEKNNRQYKRQILVEKQKMTRLLANKIVTNISKHELSDAETEVLSRGLNFVPSMTFIPNHVYSSHVNKFKQSLLRQLYFENNLMCRIIHPFCKKSSWRSPNTENVTVMGYLKRVDEDVNNLVSKNLMEAEKSNLIPKLRKALQSLGSNPNIIIKKADKGGGICVLDKDIYEQKVYELLWDRNTYKPLQNDSTKSVIRDVNNLIDYMKCHHIVDEKTANFLRPKIPHCSPLFYGLPKIHKTHIPLRPIVS